MSKDRHPRLILIVVACGLVAGLLLEELRWSKVLPAGLPPTADTLPIPTEAPTAERHMPALLASETINMPTDNVVSELRRSEIAAQLRALPGLHVCVVGPSNAAMLWSAILPLASVTSFPGVARSHGGGTHRVLQVDGPLPRSVRTYFGDRLSLRCGVSIVSTNDTDSVAVLRSVSTPPHYVLFDGNGMPSLEESELRRYLIEEQVTPNAAGGYTLRRFDKTVPLPTPGLQGVLDGSWISYNLARLDALAFKLQTAINSKFHIPLLQALRGGPSTQLINERKVYASLGRLPEVTSICEIGFNMGHSASLWLSVNPAANVYVFDLWKHDYSPVGEEYLRSSAAQDEFGVQDASARLHIVRGWSLTTVPQFAATHPNVRCDIISLRGGHTFDVVMADMDNMMHLANPRFNLVLVADTTCDASWCVDAPCYEHERRGHMVNLLRVAEHGGNRGTSVFQYVPNATTSTLR